MASGNNKNCAFKNVEFLKFKNLCHEQICAKFEFYDNREKMATEKQELNNKLCFY